MSPSNEGPGLGAAEVPATQTKASTAKRHEEYQYLDLVREILDAGEHRPDRWVCFGRTPQIIGYACGLPVAESALPPMQ